MINLQTFSTFGRFQSPRFMQFAACLCWTVVSSVLAVTVTTTAFSCWNFSRSPTRGFQRLVDIHESPHLQQVKNSVPWESSLPWVPPVIEAKKAASGIRASVWCNASCRAKFPCNNSQLKICFWDEILGACFRCLAVLSSG